MDYSLNTNVAMEVGVEAALIFQNISWWCKKNADNEVHFHDGKYWTYNSGSAFEKQFPFFNRRKISRLLANLKEAGLIETGNYNKVGFDRTQWYAVTDKGWRLLGVEITPLVKNDQSKEPNLVDALDKNDQSKVPNLVNALDKNDQSDWSKMTNGLVKNVQPIPDINTDINTDKKQQLLQQDEENWQEVLNCYQDNVHPIGGSIELDKLKELYADFSKKWLLEAIKECALNNGHSINYLTKILERWQRDGFRVDLRIKKENSPGGDSAYDRTRPEGPDNRPPDIPNHWVWNGCGWEEPYRA